LIDYTREDYTKGEQRYDLIYDLVGNHSFSERRGVLTANGICVLAGIGGAGHSDGQMSRIPGMLWSAFRSRFSAQKFVFYIAQLKKADLEFLRDWMATGKVTPVIDREFTLSEASEALRYLEQGRARGKVIVKLD
jgi:NADPH:quinone reductase-like Zn-dependent oxidoreductase